MERLNQPPNTECGPKEGQASIAESEVSRTTFGKQTQGTSQAVSGGRTPLKPSSLETVQHAGGDAVASAEPNTEASATGEFAGDLPGSKRMAREERDDGNLGRPEATRRANCGSQSGRSAQRQEERSESNQGIRSVHSSQDTTGEGADTITQPAQDSSAVRTTAPKAGQPPCGPVSE